MFDVPILFKVFNRPDVTQRVFDAIRQAQPRRLFLAQDGPRAGREDDVQNCAAVRAILDRVDWPCEVKTLYETENKGCKLSVSSAITWFFENAEQGIVLEDDCLPDPTFFTFCEEMLAKYRDVDRVKLISGDNFQDGIRRGKASYYFSRFAHIWGWASWRRAWRGYDVHMAGWPEFRRAGGLRNISHDPVFRFLWRRWFDRTHAGQINSWDYQLIYKIWREDGVAITPNVNLITNIGFGSGSTHTVSTQSRFANMKIVPLTEIIHPDAMVIDEAADRYDFYATIKEYVRAKIASAFR